MLQSSRPVRMTYFRGLNALRLYAAISVVVQHIAFSPHDWEGVPRLPDTLGRLFINGVDAVNLFLVLSGFLIMYLLLSERDATGTVSVRKFYLRRILRIWPLYFLILLLAGSVLPLIIPGFSTPLSDPALTILLIFFMGNFAFAFYFPFPPLEHLWSIGVEEQFYLVAPHLLRLRKRLHHVLFLFLFTYWLIWLAAQVFMPPLVALLELMRYDCIAIGGLFACAVYYRWPVLRLIYHPAAGMSAVATVIFAALFMQPPVPLAYTLITAAAFGILIVNVSTNEHFFLRLNHPALEYGGRLSYGIYMYHPLLLLTFYRLFYGTLDMTLYMILVYPVIIGLTLLLAHISYYYFEQPILTIKDRFKVVPVQHDAREEPEAALRGPTA